LLNDRNAKAEVVARIRGRIAALDAQTPDELLEEIDILEAQLEPHERQLAYLQNIKKSGGQLDERQENTLKELTEELIPPLETELDYISANSKEAQQFRDNIMLVQSGARITAKNGQIYQVRNLVYVFPVPEGVRANAEWMRQELGRRRNHLSFDIFNTRGEHKIVNLRNIQELQGQRLSNWVGL
jgi:hypothetical protein